MPLARWFLLMSLLVCGCGGSAAPSRDSRSPDDDVAEQRSAVRTPARESAAREQEPGPALDDITEEADEDAAESEEEFAEEAADAEGAGEEEAHEEGASEDSTEAGGWGRGAGRTYGGDYPQPRFAPDRSARLRRRSRPAPRPPTARAPSSFNPFPLRTWPTLADLPQGCRSVLVTKDPAAQSQGQLARIHIQRLRSKGYPVYGFGYKDGFALMTRPEKIDDDGEVLFRDDPSKRFAADLERPKPTGLVARAVDWFASNLRLPPGISYRAFIVTLSSEAPQPSGRRVTRDDFEPTVSREVMEPEPALFDRGLKWTDQLAYHVYVFERPTEGADAPITAGNVIASAHLASAGLQP